MTNNEYSLNPSDLATYTAEQVSDLADVDYFAVRDEGFRRQEEAQKRLDRARRALAKAEKEMRDAHLIIEAAMAERRRAA